QAIRHLLGLEFETIVFGHGPMGDKAAVERQLAYYEALAESVGQAIADGLTEDQAAESVRLDEFASWDRYDEWFPLNVRGMYRLLSDG
ncbi:MAG: MBL fold metallo-hydrolase, partial [Gemmatimonadota bacterium]|nr:MBL fold metallo-hydrolase [Gemmatimonadota bacterium]